MSPGVEEPGPWGQEGRCAQQRVDVWGWCGRLGQLFLCLEGLQVCDRRIGIAVNWWFSEWLQADRWEMVLVL